jgi:hypothetical protein
VGTNARDQRRSIMTNVAHDDTTNETEGAESETRIVYARPADPEGADHGDGGDFEAAVSKAKAYIGKAHALFDKFHGDLMNAGAVIPGEGETMAAYSEGALAFYQAVQYVDLLLDYRAAERARLQSGANATAARTPPKPGAS